MGVVLIVVLGTAWLSLQPRQEVTMSAASAATLITEEYVGPCHDRLRQRLLDPMPEGGSLDLSSCSLGVGDRMMTVRDVLLTMPYDWRANIRTLDLGSNSLRTLPFTVFHQMVVSRPVFPRLSTLFLSANHFALVPPVIRRLHLTRLSLKANRLTEVDSAELPTGLVHLILTENRIASPTGFGALTHLRKLMLSGNQMTSACGFVHGTGAARSTSSTVHSGPKMPSLELLRIARNNITHLEASDVACFGPDGAFPALRWMSLAGNPIVSTVAETAGNALPNLQSNVDCNEASVLGSGASGVVKKCQLRLSAAQIAAIQAGRPQGQEADDAGVAVLPVAVKFFKGISSDGSAADEMAILRSVPRGGAHLLRPLGRIPVGAAAPNGAAVYAVMSSPKPLGLPPTIDTVSADRFMPEKRVWTANGAIELIVSVAQAMAALSAAGVAHGDLYAHNVFHSDIVTDALCDRCSSADAAAAPAAIGAWASNATGGNGKVARVSDFGASYLFRGVDVGSADAWAANIEAMEVRSFAVFVADVMNALAAPDVGRADARWQRLEQLAADCGGGLPPAKERAHAPVARKQLVTTFSQVLGRLRTLGG